MALTGKIDFRKSWFGTLILQVEEEVKPFFSRKKKRRWRRATLMDLAQPEMRILIDMRSEVPIIPRLPLARLSTPSASSYPSAGPGSNSARSEGAIHPPVTH
jgi:hypothetical protein